MGRIPLLWTGGWDSSFRLLQVALVEKQPIQPHYVIDLERKSTLQELRAMEIIRAALLERIDDPDLIAPTEIVVRSQFAIPPDVSRRWHSLAGRVHIGTQYLWLAAVAEGLGWSGVELCMEKFTSEEFPLTAAIFAGEDGVLKDTDEAQLFKYWSFPVIRLRKEDMASEAARQGFLDLLEKSWFCHSPVGGKPCGRCRPCKLAHPGHMRQANPAIATPVLALRWARTAGARNVVSRLDRAVRSGVARTAKSAGMRPG